MNNQGALMSGITLRDELGFNQIFKPVGTTPARGSSPFFNGRG
jgi:hypothetical protein